MVAGAQVTETIAARPGVAGGGWRRPLGLAVATVIGVRLLLSIWAALTLAAAPATGAGRQPAPAGLTLQPLSLVTPWEREDALWYEKIAAQGYAPTDGTGAFFPLLPLVMRVLSVFTLGNMALAGLLAGALASVAAFTLLYRLVALDWGAAPAARAVAYLALFPTAFFLYAAFTESLFLALTLGAFWCARQGRWALVAALAALAGLTKVQGALLGLPLAAEYMIAAGWRLPRQPARLAALAGATLAGALATGAFFAYLTYVVADPLGYTTRQLLTWQHRVTWPGETLLVAAQKVLSERGITINTFDLAVLLLFTGLTVGAFRLRLSYGLQALTILLTIWFHVNPEIPLMSGSRFVLTAFPCFVVLALGAGRLPRIVHLLIITFWVSWLLVWTMIFVHGHWVG